MATVLIALGCAACATVEKAPADPRLAESQRAFDEGQRLKEAGEYAQAVPLAERALKLREEALSGKDPKVADALTLLGKLYLRQAEHARAEPLFVRALEVRKAALGETHPEVAEALNDLASLYYHQGLYARAEPLFLRALKISEASLGENHPDVASLLANLAHVYADQGLYGRAEPLYLRALKIEEAALGENNPSIAITLNSLASLYLAQALYSRAEPLLVRSLKLREAALGESHPAIATVLTNLAYLYTDQGFYARAELLDVRALKIREAALGENHPDVAQSLSSLAYVYSVQGLYERAESLDLRALKILETALGKDHPEVATMLNNLAALYKDQGLDERAEAMYVRALQIEETALGKNHPLVATSLNNLAYIYYSQGLYERAEPLYARALKIREAIFGEDHPVVASSLNNLATLYRRQGLYARAEPLYVRALQLAETALGENHPDVAQSLNNLARLRLVQQNLDAALPMLERGFTVSEHHLRQEIFGLSEKTLASVLNTLHFDENQLYALARAHPDNSRVLRLALSSALLRKGRSAQEVANTSLIISRNLGPADRDAFERLRALRTQLAALSLAGLGERSHADYQQRLKELAAEGDALEADLARRSAPLRALTALPSPTQMVDRVAQALPKDSALVEWIAYEDLPLALKSGEPALKTPLQLRYLVLVLFPDSHIRALDLGPAAPIDQAASALRDALARQDAHFQAFAQAFYQLGFRPLLPVLEGTRHLVLSPEGQWAVVPFAALHDGRRFLLDSFDFSYVTSGKDLLPRQEELTLSSSVVVFADPDFSAVPAEARDSSQAAAPGLAGRSPDVENFFASQRAQQAQQPWLPLPGTRQEAEALQRLIPRAQLFLGADASKERLLHLPTPGVLHIATHAFFRPDASTPQGTRAGGHFPTFGEGPAAQLPADPLLRSGLALAGAGAPTPASSSAVSSPRDSALVTALELAGLNLWGTELVVLSACDTGRGDIQLGQGVYGMRRALVVAGAETVIMSLWKVKDDTTSLLMASYYRNLLAGQGRASALREAMRALRLSKPHPHFWAPFIALGRDAPLRALVPARKSE